MNVYPSTNSQAVATLMPIITFFAGLLAGKGVFGFDTGTWITILSGVVGLGATLFAAWKTQKTELVKDVANLPEVTAVELDKTKATAVAIEAKTPENVVAR